MKKPKPYQARSLAGAVKEVRALRKMLNGDRALLGEEMRRRNLLILLWKGTVRWEPFQSFYCGELCFDGIRHCAELDRCGVPIVPEHLRKLLAKAGYIV